jgi:HPt (histidine-containing phosphotransfer) domain-containing protein
VVGAFLDEIPVRQSALRDAVGSGGGRPLAEAAHQLKGSALNVGAAAVAALCQELETCGRSDTAPAPDVLPQLEAQLDRAGRALTGALPVPA